MRLPQRMEMSEVPLHESCDWAVRSCDQLLLQPSTGDFQKEDEGDASSVLHFSCQKGEKAPEVTAASFTTMYQTPEVQNATETCKPACIPESSRTPPPLEASDRLGLPSNAGAHCEKVTSEQMALGHEETTGPSCRIALSCPICRIDFPCPRELKEHFKSHPPQPQDLRCWQSGCSFTAQSIKRLQCHLKREHRATPVTCSHRSCRLVFPSREEMSRHFQRHFPFHCPQCDFISSNTKLFSQHQRSHCRDTEDVPSSDSSQPLPGTPTTSGPAADLQGGTDLSSASILMRKKRGKVESANRESAGDEEPDCDSAHKKRAMAQSFRDGEDNATNGNDENDKAQQFKTFMCPECKRCFKKRTHLADHLRLHFPDPDLQCPNCLKFFTSRSKLKIHMMREAGDKAHRCPLCDYSSVERNALKRHMASLHEGVSNLYSDTYSCPMCRESFKMSQALKDHMKGHSASAAEQTLLRCFEPACAQAYSDRKEFLRHVKEQHGVRAVQCRYHACSMLFRSRGEMEEHRKNHYAFHCQDCDFVCSNKHVFRKHKMHGHPGEEELACRFCPYKSFNPIEYGDHVGKMHANEKIHRCRDCDFATAHKRVLIRHMLLHTGEKPHKCSQCDFVCRDLSYLSKHMLTHSTDKNYMCTECGYITKWKHYLTVHMRKHSGDLRYHCNQCSYRCHRADQLSSHKLRHQGKTLICEMCGFGCKRKSELQKHALLKHSQSAHSAPLYQCQYCNYQTRYKQTLRNHENGKHTKHREFRCALCPFRTFSNTSLFFHKRKSHGYIPGDKAWLESYASKQKELNNADLLFPYKTGVPITKQNCGELDGHVRGHLDTTVAECLQGEVLTEAAGDANMSVADESLLAAITLEPVETCSIEMEDFPVRLDLSVSTELLAKEPAEEALVRCQDPPAKEEILCFSEALTVETCGQDFDEETDPQTEELENRATRYDPEAAMCEISKELPLHINSNLQIQSGDISVEVQESWADMVKGGVQLTIVCESSSLDENNLREEELPTVSLEDAYEDRGPESVLKALRKRDKEQAETLVLEGRVKMLVVESKSQVYRCEKCSYVTKKKSSIVQHAKNACGLRKSALVCTECGARFKQQRGLDTHVRKKCSVLQKKRKSGLKGTIDGERNLGDDLATSATIDCERNLGDDLATSATIDCERNLGDDLATSATIDCERNLGDDLATSATIDCERNLGDDLATSATIDCERNLGDDLVTSATIDGQRNGSDDLVASTTEVITEGSHSPQRRLEALPAFQDLVRQQFQEMVANRTKRDALKTSGTVNQSEDRYRYEGGKFRCLFCSYSCTRECTINCHINETCCEARKVLLPLCQSNSSHNNQESSGGEDGHSDAEDERTEKNMVATNACKFSCPTCLFKCSQERAMKTHKKKGCLKPGELQCPLCSFRCMSASALERHRELHQKYSRNRAPLQCELCDFTCKQPRRLKQHVRAHHDGVKPHRCKYCDFSTARRYRLEAHESLHTGVGRVACDDCNRTFGTKSKLRLHRRRVHEKSPTHFCSLCDYSGYSQNDVARHLGSCHSGEPAFRCRLCQAGFSSEAALKQHSLRRHQEKAILQCAKCPFSCHSRATLRCHVQKQHLQLECAICREAFSHRQDLDEHRKAHFAHRCQQCQFAAKDRQQLVNHYTETHEAAVLPGVEAPEGSLCCPFCSFTCHHQVVYDHHVKGHGATRVYKCSDCEYSTRNKQKITWHSRIHTGEKPYKCHLCTYACADPSRLKYHMRIHKDEKNYLCPECGYKCKWVNQLKYHMTKHTGLKPYQCEECDYRTNRADALRVHRETRHREARSFICEQCGKAFKTRFLLKTHLKKHSEDKPYVCGMCQRAFRWPAGLRHHYLAHTNQRPFFCRHCPYRAKQRFQVVKHLQRHHPDHTDTEKGVGKEAYLFSIQGQRTEAATAP